MGAGASSSHGRANFKYFHQTLNEYVRLLVDFGAVGLVCFLVGILLILVRLWRTRSEPLVMSAILALVASLILAVTEPAFIYPFFARPLAIIVGLALARGRQVALKPSRAGFEI